MKTFTLCICLFISLFGTTQENLTSFGSKNFVYWKASHFNKLFSSRVESSLGLGFGYQRLMKHNLLFDAGITTTTFDAYTNDNFEPLDFEQLTTIFFMRSMEIDAQLYWFPSWGSTAAPFGFYLGGGAFFGRVGYTDKSEVDKVYLYDAALDDYLRADNLTMTIASGSGFNILGVNATAGYRFVLSPMIFVDLYANYKPIMMVGSTGSLEIDDIEQIPSSSYAINSIKNSWSDQVGFRMDEIFRWDFGIKVGVSLFRKKIK